LPPDPDLLRPKRRIIYGARTLVGVAPLPLRPNIVQFSLQRPPPVRISFIAQLILQLFLPVALARRCKVDRSIRVVHRSPKPTADQRKRPIRAHPRDEYWERQKKAMKMGREPALSSPLPAANPSTFLDKTLVQRRHSLRESHNGKLLPPNTSPNLNHII